MTPSMTRLAVLIAFVLVACKDDEAICSDCSSTEASFGLQERTVHDARSKTFPGEDGLEYTLVRVEYGDTQECSEWDDEDCWYSSYCGFVVDNTDYPLEVYWVSDADALFDPAVYCEDGELEGCELPGQTLPILEDELFEEWMYETDPEDDVLVDCFAEYY
jgi:hypothetical protein